MRRKKSIGDVQTGRNLPNRFNSYSPSHDHPPQDKTANTVALEPEAAKKRSIFKRVVLVLLMMAFLFCLIIAVWDARNISAAESKLFGSGNVLNLISADQPKGSETGRVNILLVGYSVDDPGHPGAKLTDSLILLSMSTTNHTGYMLSIPRDLYVKIPGFGYAKINEAYEDGGMDLLEQVIAANFDTSINYYALINYATVRDTVNALGGVTVDIDSPDPRGLFDTNISPHDGGPLKLSNGPQQVDGQTALNLTRARGDSYNAYGFPQADFDRTQHQRQVLAAIKAKLNWKLVLNPHKNSQILNAVATNIKTDVNSSEVRSVFGLFNSIPNTNLQSISLRSFNGKNYLASYTTPYGQSALIPAAGLNDYSAINEALSALN